MTCNPDQTADISTVRELMKERDTARQMAINNAEGLAIATETISTLTARIERLEAALTDARDDLNIRAVKGVVPVGNSVWLQINRALENKP